MLFKDSYDEGDGSVDSKKGQSTSFDVKAKYAGSCQVPSLRGVINTAMKSKRGRYGSFTDLPQARPFDS